MSSIPRSNIQLGQHRADYQARAVLDEARRNNLRQVFTGAKLVRAKTSFVMDLFWLRRDSKSVQSNAKQAGGAAVQMAAGSYIQQARQQVRQAEKNALLAVAGPLVPIVEEGKRRFFELLREIYDQTPLAEIIEELTHNLVYELAGEVAPYLGTLKSGGQTLTCFFKSIWQIKNLIEAKWHSQVVLPGDPAGAAAALRELIERQIAYNTIRTGQNALVFTGKVGGIAADYGALTGPALGAANAFVSLIHRLVLMARDYREMKKANKRLQHPDTLDASIFQVCPILGCYLLLESDTSAIVNLLTSDIGKQNWNVKAQEQIEKHLYPLLDTAQAFVRDARYVLEGLKTNRSAFIRGSGPGASLARVQQNAKKAVLSRFGKG